MHVAHAQTGHSCAVSESCRKIRITDAFCPCLIWLEKMYTFSNKFNAFSWFPTKFNTFFNITEFCFNVWILFQPPSPQRRFDWALGIDYLRYWLDRLSVQSAMDLVCVQSTKKDQSAMDTVNQTNQLSNCPISSRQSTGPQGSFQSNYNCSTGSCHLWHHLPDTV